MMESEANARRKKSLESEVRTLHQLLFSPEKVSLPKELLNIIGSTFLGASSITGP